MTSQSESFLPPSEAAYTSQDSTIAPVAPPVDFVIVTALTEEREAVLHQLPNHQRLPPSNDDIRIYYTASLPVTLANGLKGGYSIVVLSLPNMGRVEASNATGDAIRRWRPRYVVLVGIAGGVIPRNSYSPAAVTEETAKSSISLGDVLIASQIVDYELQKLTPDEAKGEIRWRVYEANALLLNAARHLPDTNWRRLVSRRRPTKGAPKTHIGPMASGDKVVAFDRILDRYRTVWPKLIGVEMEAGGAASAAFERPQPPGFFMIRGISDFANEEKGMAHTEKWRSYACDTAAAYVIALLQSGPITFQDSYRHRSSSLAHIELRDEWFHGREELLSRIDRILVDETLILKCTSIYGFAGVGKSALAREAVRRARRRGFTTIQVGIFTLGPYESLSSLVHRHMEPANHESGFTSEYEILSRFIKDYLTDKSVLVIEEFRGQDTKLIANLNWFLDLIAQSQRSTLVVIVSRQRPVLKATMPIEYVHVEPFDEQDTNVLVSKWARHRSLLNHSTAIYEMSDGHPQLVQYICRNEAVFQRVLESKKPDFDVLREVWRRVGSSTLREPIELLSVASQFQPEIPGELMDELVEDWPSLVGELLDRSLVQSTTHNVFRIHALLGSYVFEQTSGPRKRHLSGVLGRSYSSKQNQFDLMLAFYHLVSAEDVTAAAPLVMKLCDVFRFDPYSDQSEIHIRKLIDLTPDAEHLMLGRLLENLGFMHIIANRYEDAKAELDRANQLYKSINYHEGEGWTSHGLGVIHRMQVNLSDALERFESAERTFRSIDDLRGVAWSTHEQNEVLKSLGEYDTAYDLANRSWDLIQAVGDEVIFASMQRGLGELNLVRYDFDGAIQSYNRAITLSQKRKDKVGEAYALDGLSSVCRLLGKYDKAVEYSRQACGILSNFDDKAGKGFLKFGLAEALRMLGEYDEARTEYSLAQEIAKSIQHLDVELFSLLGIAEVFRATQRYQEAQNAYQSTLTESRKRVLRLIEAHSLLGIAEVYRLQYVSSQAYYDNAYDLYMNLKSQWGVVHTLIGSGLAALQSGETALYHQKIREAQHISKEYSLKAELHFLAQDPVDNYHAFSFPLR